MDSKILHIFTKVVIILAVLILCSSSFVSAFSFGIRNDNNKTSMIGSLIDKLFNNNKEYSLENLKEDLENMKALGNFDMSKITELINKLPAGENKDIMQGIKDMFSKFPGIDGEGGIKTLLDKLINAVKSLLGGLGSSSGLPVEAESIYMDAQTAAEFAGNEYKVKLHASVYKHVDENGNEDSDKWAVLIHPFMLKGESIAKKIGPYYYEKGYNIIAPDLRSFGESEGEVALGFLESLDTYDWLNLLNKEYNTSKVIVHGVSLGAATTNFLSGIDEFINNGPTKINTQIKSLRELNVIGLVEDCGYTDMTQFANESFLLNMNIGLTEDNFEYYSDATNSLKYCDLPMLVIHGTNDTTVKPENATTVVNTVKGETEYWSIEGGPHAGIIMGLNGEEYKTHVQNFIDKYENTVTKPSTPTEDEEDKPTQKPEEDKPEEDTETGGFFNKIINALKSLVSRR